MKNSRKLWLIALLLAALGFGLRMVDLQDPPVDFHPTRQFRGALIARDIYYDLLPDADPQRQALAAEMAADFPEFEPPVLEFMVALGYLLLGSEALWLARLIVSLAWCLGGLALFALVKDSVSGVSALVALGYYLFLPFGLTASRSFQPDPLMTVMVILVMLAAYRWSESFSWRWAVLTGLLGAGAVLFKVVAAYLIMGLMAALVLKVLGIKKALRNAQVWAIAALMIVLPGLYYFFGIGESSSNYFQNWIVAMLPLVTTPDFYIGWLKRLYAFRALPMLAALLGIVFFAKDRGRWMLWGLWIGYALYGFSLPHQTATHSYYHLQITPLVAWSLAYTVDWGLEKIGPQRRRWQSALLAAVLLLNFYWVYKGVSTLLVEDHHAEPPYWASVGEQVPDDGETIGLVQFYGHLLMYYGWTDVELWPESGELYLAEIRGNPDVNDFPTLFEKKTEGMDYFLVTTFREFERQTELYNHLYENYPVYAEGPGYLIFDLRDPIK